MTVRNEWDMECPQCKADNGILISVIVPALLTAHGTDIDGGDHHWEPDHAANCASCGFYGTVRDFNIPLNPVAKFISTIAHMTVDGESMEDGSEFDMVSDDAVEVLNALIQEARELSSKA